MNWRQRSKVEAIRTIDTVWYSESCTRTRYKNFWEQRFTIKLFNHWSYILIWYIIKLLVKTNLALVFGSSGVHVVSCTLRSYSQFHLLFILYLMVGWLLYQWLIRWCCTLLHAMIWGWVFLDIWSSELLS